MDSDAHGSGRGDAFDEPMEPDLFASDDERSDGGRSSGEDNNQLNENGDNEGKTDEDLKKKVKPKREGPPRKLLLNEDMVCGKDGLLKLEKIFKDFKLRGQGHELQDINAILCKLEHWLHLLHPKYTFSQTLERLEFLGLKRRSVKVHMKKIRTGQISQDTAFLDENNMPEFEPSDHEMDFVGESNGLEEPVPSGNDLDFPEDDNPIIPMSDDDDDAWLLEALNKVEERGTDDKSQAPADEDADGVNVNRSQTEEHGVNPSQAQPEEDGVNPSQAQAEEDGDD